MSDTPRRWFPILVTVVMLPVAGGFLWMNLINLNPGVPCGGQMGWPFAYLLDSPFGFRPSGTFDSVAPKCLSPHLPAVMNVLAALFVLFFIARFGAWLFAPKRRWPQIHLSTAIVMMLAAAGLMALNAHAWHTYMYDPVIYSAHGWPVTCVTIAHSKGQAEWRWDKLNVSSDAFVCFALMYTTVFLLEWRIRRREAREA